MFLVERTHWENLVDFCEWHKNFVGSQHCLNLQVDVEFVLAPQHETSCDPETTAKEDFDY